MIFQVCRLTTPPAVENSLRNEERDAHFAGSMVTIRQIEDLSRRIVREFHPERIVLFGSYAHGTVTPDSDVDLLIVLPFQGKAAKMSVEIRLRARPAFAVDLIVRTPEKLRERLAMDDDFVREILENGKVLYEADHG